MSPLGDIIKVARQGLLDVAGYPNSPGAANRKLLGNLVINRDHTQLIRGEGVLSVVRFQQLEIIAAPLCGLNIRP